MGRKGKQAQKLLQESTKPRPEAEEDVSGIIREIWDKIYTLTDCHYSSESHADWPQLQAVIAWYLVSSPPPVNILVPACGNSRLSEHLYDAGFTSITNVDYSSLVIAHMLKRNVRERPLMKWRVADVTKMEQFGDETFDVVLDKGGLDCLMNPKLGPLMVSQYLYEVKRLLKAGGKYMCVTWGGTNAFAQLFQKFRFGWSANLHAIEPSSSGELKQQTFADIIQSIPLEPSSSGDLKQQAFVLVAEKLTSTAVSQISLSLDEYSPEHHGNSKTEEFYSSLEREATIRSGYSSDPDVFTPFEDLVLVEKVNFSRLEPGRRLRLTIGDFGESRFFYDSILIDVPVDAGPFSRPYLVQVIPNYTSYGWLLAPTEGQWVHIKARNAARVLMVILYSRHANAERKDILSDIAPLYKKLAPGQDNESEIPVIVADDAINDLEILHKVNSALSGLIVVDDVFYKNLNRRFPDKYIVRRLKIESFMVAEALYTIEGATGVSSGVEKSKVPSTSKAKKKKKKGGTPHSGPSEPHGEARSASAAIKFDHSYLASQHHNAIISGLMLIYEHFGGSTSLVRKMKTLLIGSLPVSEVKTVIIGLRAGLLSMFMNSCLPYLSIEVVEEDPLMLDISREYFGFCEDQRLKVHIGNGVEFVREKANSSSDGNDSSKIDILIVDWDLPHSRSSQGFTSPPAQFVDESFLLDVKKLLSENGLFIINIIAWSSSAKGSILSKLKAVFSSVFSIHIMSDTSEVIFALNSESPVNDSELIKARDKLTKSLGKGEDEWGGRVIHASKFINPLK